MSQDLSSIFFSNNANFIEEMYVEYVNNKESVSKEWQDFFSNLGDEENIILQEKLGASWKPNNNNSIIGVVEKAPEKKKKENKVIDSSLVSETIKAFNMINNYRKFGHTKTNLDPLSLQSGNISFLLDKTYYQFKDFNQEIDLFGELGINKITISDLYKKLNDIYSNRVGAEISYIENDDQRLWLQAKVESLNLNCNNNEKKEILEKIIPSTLFEDFLHTKYPGAKRFSIEGGESMLSSIYSFLNQSSNLGTTDIVLGMPHRGRLSLLTELTEKPYEAMLSEFQGNFAFPEHYDISGDVKYHLGASVNKALSNGKNIYISMCANPSHLEAINPVVIGRVRGKQDRIGDAERKKVAGILLHGDAAFCGQGVVAESLAISDLKGYRSGGIFHIVVNNNIGFTTNPHDGRVVKYPTEFAKIIQAPVFHVNGDDPEAVYKVSQLAAEFRYKFAKDVVIDIVCYRRYGHNEGDEPMFTQPQMYSMIKQKKTLLELYSQKLIQEKIISNSEYEQKITEFKEKLNKSYDLAQDYKVEKADFLEKHWSNIEYDINKVNNPVTAISHDEIDLLAKKITEVPDNIKINSKIKKQLANKIKNICEKKDNIDWGTGEALAFASLVNQDVSVRISGQDCKRGTFSHRHAVIFDQENEFEYIPINNIKENQQNKLEVINSNLSEYGVLGFEYGYSLSQPQHLTIWEAQFGDFANGAQIIIDQFIAAGETKWLKMSGLVLLLPHGYEGQGPEHSSARLERFLQLCADNNMQVVNCTTPAQYFHLLRRQVIRNTRKPLIVMSPKSLLRRNLAVSKVSDFTDITHFQNAIDDNCNNKENIEKVIICSGKVYYDLFEERKNRNIDNIALVRIEQLYPFPSEELKKILSSYKNASFYWCQEEHKNMGGWFFVRDFIEEILCEITQNPNARIKYLGRKESASTSAGYAALHVKEYNLIIDSVFNN